MSRIFKIAAYILVTIFAIILILPIGWMVLGSFRTDEGIAKLPSDIIPDEWIIKHYVQLFDSPILRWTVNSLIVAFGGTSIMTLITCLAGYAFAKKKIKAKEPIFWILLSSIMIPGTATLVPLMILIKDMGLIDTLAGVMLPGLLSMVYIYFFRQYVQDIPNDYLDVAEIDGAGEFRKFFSVIVPLSKSAIVTIFLLSFMGSWNLYVWPLLVLFTPDKMTVPLGVQQIMYNEVFFRALSGLPNYGLMQAAGTYVLFPMVLLFTIGHRYFVKGLWGGGIKE